MKMARLGWVNLKQGKVTGIGKVGILEARHM